MKWPEAGESERRYKTLDYVRDTCYTNFTEEVDFARRIKILQCHGGVFPGGSEV